MSDDNRHGQAAGPQTPETAPAVTGPTPETTVTTTETEAAAEAENAEQTTEPNPEPAKKHKPGPWERRYRREMSQLQQTVQALAARLPVAGLTQQATAAAGELKSPQEADFKDYGQYLEARASYAAQKMWAEAEQQRQAQARAAEEQTRAATFAERQAAAAAKYEDFDEVAFNPDAPLTGAMHATLLESPSGPDLQYFLGKNPDEAARIARLSPVQQIFELGKIQAKLDAPKTKPVTQAPEPAPTVATTAAKPRFDYADSATSIEEWVKRRNRQEAEARKRRA